jgi:hypothetical protein
MSLNVDKELAVLQRMTTGQLREKYAAVFGEQTNGRNKTWLVRRIIWRMQANAEGGLSERARQRAEELAAGADLRLTAPPARPAKAPDATAAVCTIPFQGDRRLPPPGTVLTRKYKGRTLQVKVLADGFEYEGEAYRSLTAVAKAITGSHCNGYLFFRLTGKAGAT